MKRGWIRLKRPDRAIGIMEQKPERRAADVCSDVEYQRSLSGEHMQDGIAVFNENLIQHVLDRLGLRMHERQRPIIERESRRCSRRHGWLDSWRHRTLNGVGLTLL